MKRIKDYVRKNVRVLSMDDVTRICIDKKCNEDAIHEALKKYNTDDKYKGIQSFEWQTTETRADVQEKKRQKQ